MEIDNRSLSINDLMITKTFDRFEIIKKMNNNSCRDFKYRPISSGTFFKSDQCKICLCSNGSSIFCTTKLCTPPDGCVNSVRKFEECCKFDCHQASNVSSTTYIKVINLEADSVKQGARFGATALTISIIVSLFIFMLMRLKRRQTLLNSLSQRSSLGQQNLLFEDNNLDGLAQLRRLLRRGRMDRFHSFPSTSDFSHFLPVSSLSATVCLDDESCTPTFESNNVDIFSPLNTQFFGLNPPSYDAPYEKNEDRPPPYEAPPPYSETDIGDQEIAGESVASGSEACAMEESNVHRSDSNLFLPTEASPIFHVLDSQSPPTQEREAA